MDWEITTHGSIWLFNAVSSEARQWGIDCFPEDCPMMGGAYAAEARFANDITRNLLDEGFTASLDGQQIEATS